MEELFQSVDTSDVLDDFMDNDVIHLVLSERTTNAVLSQLDNEPLVAKFGCYKAIRSVLDQLFSEKPPAEIPVHDYLLFRFRQWPILILRNIRNVMPNLAALIYFQGNEIPVSGNFSKTLVVELSCVPDTTPAVVHVIRPPDVVIIRTTPWWTIAVPLMLAVLVAAILPTMR